MEGLLVVQLFERAFLDGVELDELLEDVGHEDRLLAGLRVLVLDNSLGHEVVHIVFFLEFVVVYLGVDIDCLLLVDELLAEL